MAEQQDGGGRLESGHHPAHRPPPVGEPAMEGA
jgi:hypothetical protein